MATGAAAAGAAPVLAPVIVAADPLDDVRLVLGICELTPNIDRFILCHGIKSMKDFKYMEHEKTESVVKMHNDRYRTANQKIGFPVQKEDQKFPILVP